MAIAAPSSITVRFRGVDHVYPLLPGGTLEELLRRHAAAVRCPPYSMAVRDVTGRYRCPLLLLPGAAAAAPGLQPGGVLEVRGAVTLLFAAPPHRMIVRAVLPQETAAFFADAARADGGRPVGQYEFRTGRRRWGVGDELPECAVVIARRRRQQLRPGWRGRGRRGGRA